MNCANDEEELCESGRPRITIGEEQLSFLVKNGFRITDIANFAQCSRRTIEQLKNGRVVTEVL